MKQATLPTENQAILMAPTKARALALLREGRAAGTLAGVPTQIRQIGPDQYAIPVYLLPQRRQDPAWAVRCRAAGFILLGVAAVLGALAWLLSTLTVVALATAIITVGAVFLAFVWVKYGRRGSSVTVMQQVTVRR